MAITIVSGAEIQAPYPLKPKRWRRRLLIGAGVSLLLILALFTINGLVLAHAERVVLGDTRRGEAVGSPAGQLKVMAWNLAKCFVYDGGVGFASRQQVEDSLAAMAVVIRREAPDLLFLSEVVTECTPCDVDQLAYLARATGMRHWAFGENFNFGLPFLRMVGGNAILSKRPLQAIGNHDLVGRRPFWVTENNRRILWCSTTIGGLRVRLGSMHTDSFDLDNNLRQTAQILAESAGVPTILAGDFNATPDDASMRLVQDSGRFSGLVAGPGTFPAGGPVPRFDYVLAPKNWVLVSDRVLDDQTSDHRPVVAVFRVVR